MGELRGGKAKAAQHPRNIYDQSKIAKIFAWELTIVLQNYSPKLKTLLLLVSSYVEPYNPLLYSRYNKKFMKHAQKSSIQIQSKNSGIAP